MLASLAGCAQTESWLGIGTVAQKPSVSQTTSTPAPDNDQTAGSRLQNEPWPPGIGQPYPPPPFATAALNPALAVPKPASGKIKVAILLPLSGKNAALGQAMLNAAQLAVFDVADNNFELMPRDTGVSPEAATQDAIASGAQLLIGPLFASNVAAVKPLAQNAHINMLVLSTDISLAGSDVFVMGFAPAAQVERVVAFAHAHGLHNFAAIVPKNTYGDLVGEVFQSAVQRAGDQLVAYETYNPLSHDSDRAVADLAAARDHIDALFLPESGDELARISGQLLGAGFDNQKIRPLGTGLWDVPGLGQNASFIIGGWYAASDPKARQNFVTAYRQTYGDDPPRLVTLAYDATALAAMLAKRGGSFDRIALTNPNGFAGIDGIFRLTQEGLVERGLAVDQVTEGGDQAISAAPASFVTRSPKY